MDEFEEVNSYHMPAADSTVQLFYNKISELPVKSWHPLQDKYYRLTQMGTMQFTETGKFNDLPNLSYFNYSQASNGGPIGKFLEKIVTFMCSGSRQRKDCDGGPEDSPQPHFCFQL